MLLSQIRTDLAKTAKQLTDTKTILDSAKNNLRITSDNLEKEKKGH